MSQKTRNNFLFMLLLLSIILISSATTYAFIKNAEQNTPTEEVNREYYTFKPVDEAPTIDIYKEYPINPISILYNDGKVSIDGLKDDTIENKINEKLSDLEESKNEYGNSNCHVLFNISNVLSINCGSSSKNIALTTGEYIGIEEIFQKDSQLHPMIMDMLYKGSCSRSTCEEGIQVDDEYSNNIENFISAAYKKIINDDYDFNINYSNVDFDFAVGDYLYFNLDYYNYKDEVTIYDRFLTEDNIYESELTEYCNTYNCYSKSLDVTYEDSYSFSDFLNEDVYLNLNVRNESDYNYDYSSNGSKTNYDMEKLGEKITNEIIAKENLNRTRDNKTFLSISSTIYDIGELDLISYYIMEYEMTDEEFEDLLLNNYTFNYDTSTSVGMSMTVDKNGNISTIETDPNKVFKNFHSRINSYIEEIKDIEDSSINPFQSLSFCVADDDVCKQKTAVSRVVNLASYAVDIENQKLYMYYEEAIPDPYMGGTMIYIKATIPFDIFSLKENAIQLE